MKFNEKIDVNLVILLPSVNFVDCMLINFLNKAGIFW
jgi:hypothetical protein